MPWRGLLRIVDMEGLLTAQAALADALEGSARRHGQESEEAQTLREGFNLLAKVLFTRRATIADVHDLAWLDHLVVSKGERPSRLWHGEAARTAWESLATTRGRLAEMIPRGHTPSWAHIAVTGFGGTEPVKFERGVAGRIRVGLVTFDGALELMDEVALLKARDEEGAAILRELRRLAVELRHGGRETAALVLAASSG